MNGEDLTVLFLLSLLLLSVAVFVVTSLRVAFAKVGTFNMPRKETDIEDCMESASMLVDFISDGLEDSGRKYRECSDAGCEGSSVLRNSKDIARLVKALHDSGARIVLRRVSDDDIESGLNTPSEVRKELEALDIRRARRMEGGRP